VPVGTYELFVNSVPGSFVQPAGAVDTFVVTEGSDVELINELTFNQALIKTVCIAEFDDDADIDDEFPFVCDADGAGDGTNLAGVNVTIFEIIGEDFLDFPVTSTEIVFEGETGDDGTVTVPLAPGDYLLCLTDEDGEATTVDGGETVNPMLLEEIDATILCDFGLLGGDSPFGEIFEIEAGVDEEIDNPVFLESGTINLFIGTEDDTAIVPAQADETGLNPVEGVEICLDDFDTLTCVVSDENGHASFDVELFDLNDEFGGGFPLTRSLQGGSEFGELGEWYYIEIYSDDYDFVCADGGELTAEVYTTNCDGSNLGGVQGGDQPTQDFKAVFEIFYDPTADVQQDGFSDDVDETDELRGSYDIVVELDPVMD
jgi:hypothetical protein